MNKKWLRLLPALFLSLIMVGCNMNEEPAEDQNDTQETPPDEDMNETNGNGNKAPGVDENDTINKDDEKDKDPDPEDPIEDAEDTGDADNKDE